MYVSPNDLEELVVSIFRAEELQIHPKHWEEPTWFHDIMSKTTVIIYADKTAQFNYFDDLINTYFWWLIIYYLSP